MERKVSRLTRFLTWSSKQAGRPITFIIAMGVVVLWIILGFMFGFSNRWILIIDTVATINASLMVFIIQSTQYRESKALHLKLDELIRTSKEAQKELMAIEHMEEEDQERLRERYHQESPPNF